MLLNDGQMIRGTYEVERYLGDGAFAEVYRVRHRFLGRQAMKVFKSTRMTAEQTEEMLGEAVILSRLGHPNIVRVFDANITETSRGTSGFFTMEYVAGGTLENFWRSHGDKFVSLEHSIDIIRQVCRGITVAHSESPPIIHRDIKPQNILVGYDGNGLLAKVSDFGLAKQVNPLTLMATTKGTRSFKPPEAFTELEKNDSRAGDVWAIGSVLYLLLTDKLPYAGDNDPDALSNKRFETPLDPPSRLNIHVDPELDQILFRALAQEPGERYPGAEEMLRDLERWQPKPLNNKQNNKKASLNDESKNALGVHSVEDIKLAKDMTRTALKLATQADRLMEAADLMEEAFNKAPPLREKYEYQLKLWRRGVVM